MIFLQPLYNFLQANYSQSINHFSLVKLVLFSLDKTILYFLIFAVFRIIWLLIIKKRRSFFSEFLVWLFAFYLLLLFSLTVFRGIYFPWQLHFDLQRSLSEINLTFLTETIKLAYASAKLDFFYNSLGNILWFVPFGFLLPAIKNKRNNFYWIVGFGLILSLVIEALQFLLETGVTDIDDVFFNLIGTIIGYGLYAITLKKRRNKPDDKVLM